MCRVLKIARSTLYYKENPRKIDVTLENAVIDEFRKSRNNYGTRKLKVMLSRRQFHVSKRRIGKIMTKYHLASNYTIRHGKKQRNDINNDEITNVVD